MQRAGAHSALKTPPALVWPPPRPLCVNRKVSLIWLSSTGGPDSSLPPAAQTRWTLSSPCSRTREESLTPVLASVCLGEGLTPPKHFRNPGI